MFCLHSSARHRILRLCRPFAPSRNHTRHQPVTSTIHLQWYQWMNFRFRWSVESVHQGLSSHQLRLQVQFAVDVLEGPFRPAGLGLGVLDRWGGPLSGLAVTGGCVSSGASTSGSESTEPRRRSNSTKPANPTREIPPAAAMVAEPKPEVLGENDAFQALLVSSTSHINCSASTSTWRLHVPLGTVMVLLRVVAVFMPIFVTSSRPTRVRSPSLSV